jgi:hypothetical protein
VKHVRYRIAGLIAGLSHERAQTTPNYAISLSIVSGTSLLHFTSVPRNAATALIGLARLFT